MPSFPYQVPGPYNQPKRKTTYSSIRAVSSSRPTTPSTVTFLSPVELKSSEVSSFANPSPGSYIKAILWAITFLTSCFFAASIRFLEPSIRTFVFAAISTFFKSVIWLIMISGLKSANA